MLMASSHRSRNLRLLHESVPLQPQVFRFPRKEAESYTSDIFTIFNLTLYSMFLPDDFGLPACFAVNNACWDLVRQFGKRNCAKWKKGTLFSVDERQIRGRKNEHINQNNRRTGQNMQRWRRTQWNRVQ